MPTGRSSRRVRSPPGATASRPTTPRSGCRTSRRTTKWCSARAERPTSASSSSTPGATRSRRSTPGQAAAHPGRPGALAGQPAGQPHDRAARTEQPVLYVLNSDLNTPDIFSSTSGTASIQGYYVSDKCALTAIPGSHRLTTSRRRRRPRSRSIWTATRLPWPSRTRPEAASPAETSNIFPVDQHGRRRGAGRNRWPPHAPNRYGMAWEDEAT